MKSDNAGMAKRVLITGASGFLGGAMATSFASRPGYQVVATSRRPADLGDALTYVCGDLCDAEFCDAVTRGIKYIVHCAALSSPWGSYDEFHRANVVATRHLMEAAIKNGVSRFIFISTPSIYFNYTDRLNVREVDPLPDKMVNWYAHTKLEAERYVLGKCNDGIETLALRPRAIIGAGDLTIFPRLLKAHVTKKLSIIGDGQVVCDLTCVNNVIHAADVAMSADSKALGLAYNIADGTPVKLWDTINSVFSQLGYDTVKRKVPFAVAALYASMMEQKYKAFNKGEEPPLTRFGIGVLGKSMTMSIDRARHLLQYTPVQTTEEGLAEFISWFKMRVG
jgi:nucleoside-diphosphate-sugar epimerase